MALHHAESGELIDVRPLDDGLAGAQSRTLYKSARLEVIRSVLLAGRQVPPHSIAGDLTVQCLEGRIAFTFAGTTRTMQGGDLLCLAGGTTYSLNAIDDASVLITMELAQGF
jgi:quercetin dioxygenase-like cupin family protein